MRNTGVMDYSEKKRSVTASRVGHRARARVQRLQGEEMKVFYFSCSIPDARRGYRAFFFLKIHNSHIFHPCNLNLHKSLLILICKNWKLVLRRDM